jgi:hypothetical protein
LHATAISVAYISNYFIVKKTVDTLRIRSIKVVEEVVVVIDDITAIITSVIASGTHFTLMFTRKSEGYRLYYSRYPYALRDNIIVVYNIYIL